MMVLQIIMYTVGNVLDNDISKKGGNAPRAMDLKRRKKFPNPPQASFYLGLIHVSCVTSPFSSSQRVQLRMIGII